MKLTTTRHIHCEGRPQYRRRLGVGSVCYERVEAIVDVFGAAANELSRQLVDWAVALLPET